MGTHNGYLFVILSLAVGSALGTTDAQAGNMDGCYRGESVTAADESRAAYQRHGDGHCEGFYLQPISAITGVEIVGFQYGGPVGEALLEGDQVLPLALSAPLAGKDHQIIGRSLDPDSYYQTDTTAAGDDSFGWDLSLLRGLEEPARVLPFGFVACEGTCRGRNVVYSPVRIGPAGEQRLALILQARVSLSKIYYKLTSKNTGQEAHSNAIELGRHPPRRPVKIDIPSSLSSGEYDLNIYSVATNGQTDQLKAAIVVP